MFQRNITFITFIAVSGIMILFITNLYNKQNETNDNKYVGSIPMDNELKTEEENEEINAINASSISIANIRMDYSVKGSDNAILAYAYYDKPFVCNQTEAAKKINSYFEEEYQWWLDGYSGSGHAYKNVERESLHKYKFFERVKEFREFNGDEILKTSNFYNYINSEVVFCNDNILSIKQISFSQTYGVSTIHYLGTTFDLNTGEVLPLDKLIDINADDFRNKILSYVMENIAEKYYTDSYDESYEINHKIYAPNENHDFKLGYWGEPYALNYDYYYDGEYYYIILRNVKPINYEIILKWSGNMEDEFEGIYNYFHKKDNTFELIKND